MSLERLEEREQSLRVIQLLLRHLGYVLMILGVRRVD